MFGMKDFFNKSRKNVNNYTSAGSESALSLPPGTVRWHIIFYGRVQGVGFRYYSTYIARNLGLTGWVQNLSDGTVEMEVQGMPNAIYSLFDQLSATRYIVITEKEIDVIPLDPSEETFREVGW